MKKHRIIVFIVTLSTGACAGVPAGALAAGPLLSGYGGPGDGAQVILGATLVGPPGSGGSGSGGSGGGALGGSRGTAGTSGSTGTGAGSTGTGTSPGGAGSNAGARLRSAAGGERLGGGRGAARSPGSGGASTGSGDAFRGAERTGASGSIATGTETAWFSGGDLLALALVAGALAITAVATVRLTRTEHD